MVIDTAPAADASTSAWGGGCAAPGQGPIKPIILGIDPGSRVTGYALLRGRRQPTVAPRDLEIVEAGVFKVDAKLPYIERVGLLHATLFDLLSHFRPQVCVIEKAFFGANISSALKLGEIRGAFMAACARAEVAMAEITPAEVKKTVTGNGRAEKSEVAAALKALLGVELGNLPLDASDAIAMAFCFALGLKRHGPGWANSVEPAHGRLKPDPLNTARRRSVEAES